MVILSLLNSGVNASEFFSEKEAKKIAEDSCKCKITSANLSDNKDYYIFQRENRMFSLVAKQKDFLYGDVYVDSYFYKSNLPINFDIMKKHIGRVINSNNKSNKIDSLCNSCSIPTYSEEEAKSLVYAFLKDNHRDVSEVSHNVSLNRLYYVFQYYYWHDYHLIVVSKYKLFDNPVLLDQRSDINYIDLVKYGGRDDTLRKLLEMIPNWIYNKSSQRNK